MRTEQPLANLHRRLRGRAEPIAASHVPNDPNDPNRPDDPNGPDDPDDPDGEDDGAPAPSWIPDERASRGLPWLSAIRADPGRAGVLALGVLGVLAVLVTVFTLIRQSPAPVTSAKLPPVAMVSSAAPQPGTAAPVPPSAPDQSVVVSVVGLVHQPGLVTLAPGARIADAMAAAGGPLKGADTVGLNLARRVADGEQIVVGIATPAGHPVVLGSSVGPGTSATGNLGPAAGSVAGPTPSSPVDLNTATVEELDTLPGVGPVTAAAIVTWRQANGRFTTVDQLGEVDGIGPARLEKLRPRVRVEAVQ